MATLREATALANALHIQPEVIFGYVNEHNGELPQSLVALETWGNQTTKYGFPRRDPTTGAWRPVMPGPTPGTGGPNDPGFRHVIANAEDSRLEPFLSFPDPMGVGRAVLENQPGWIQAFNDRSTTPGVVHGVPMGGMANLPAATGPRTALGSSALGGNVQAGRSAQVASNGNPYQPGTTEAGVWDAANPPDRPFDPNTPAQTGGGVPPASSGASSGGGKTLDQMTAELRAAGYPGPWDESSVRSAYARTAVGGGGGGTGGGTGINPDLLGPANTAANNAAMMAYYNARLALDRDVEAHRDENEKHRIALEAARDAANKAHLEAGDTGYISGTGAQGKGQAVMDALGGLRNNPQYQAADGETRRAMEAATVAQATGIDTASARQAIDRLRTLTATTGQPSSAALVEQVLGQTPGGAGQKTLGRESEENRTAMDALRLLSTLRGPENAFVYADTLNSIPASMRANIQAAMGRLPFTPQNPAQRGLFGDVGVGAAGGGPGAESTWQQTGADWTPGAPGAAYTPVTPSPTTYGQSAPAGPQAEMDRSATGAAPAGQWQSPLLGGTQPAGRQPTSIGPGQWSNGYYANTSRGNPQPGMSYEDVLTPMGPGGDPGSMGQWTPMPLRTWSPTGAGAAAQPGQPQPGNPMGGVPPAYGPRTAPAPGGLTPAGSWSPTDYNRTGSYGRRLMLAGYEHAGQDPQEVMDQYQRSLPRAYGPRSGRLAA